MVTASAIDFTCPNVPIPKRATATPKKANNFAKTLEKMLRVCYISIARLILNCVSIKTFITGRK